jgi:hypothetical protein
LARGDDGTVDMEFQIAFDLLERADSADRLSHAHGEYAELLEARGDMSGAVRHLKQALATRPARPTEDLRAATA